MPGPCLPQYSLQSIFLNQIGESSPNFDKIVCRFLESKQSFSEDLVEACQWRDPFVSEDRAIVHWQHLLAINMLSHLMGHDPSEVAAKVRLYGRNPWNQSSQYFRSLVAINHAFAKMPIPEVGPHLLESGAALIDLHEYCPWLSLPYTPQHLEFGIYLSLLALLAKRSDFQETVVRIATWQINLLDAHGDPLPAFFVREKEGRSLNHLVLHYLLFRCASLFSTENSFSSLAEAALKTIDSILPKTKETINPLSILIDECLNQFRTSQFDSSFPLQLPEHLYDPSTALVGYRTEMQQVVCTLHGEHTGLGALRYGNIDIVNYGPQYFPLNDCEGFGIEGNALSDRGVRRSVIEWRRASFILKGCTRMVDQPSSRSHLGHFRGIWLEVVQEFKKPHFYLKTTFLGLDGWEEVAFSFFVKASSCKIQSRELLPRTLDRYHGEAKTLLLDDGKNRLELRPLSFEGKMEVIPLAGGSNFWGADFLIAYMMTADQRNYQWHIGPPRGS